MLEEGQKPIELDAADIPRKNNEQVRKTQTLSSLPVPARKSFLTTTAENGDLLAGGAEKFLWGLAGSFFVSISITEGWMKIVMIAGCVLSSLLAVIFGIIKHLLPQSPVIAKIKSVKRVDDGKKTFSGK